MSRRRTWMGSKVLVVSSSRSSPEWARDMKLVAASPTLRLYFDNITPGPTGGFMKRLRAPLPARFLLERNNEMIGRFKNWDEVLDHVWEHLPHQAADRWDVIDSYTSPSIM